jgi:hypothetical protein
MFVVSKFAALRQILKPQKIFGSIRNENLLVDEHALSCYHPLTSFIAALPDH